MGLQNIPRPTTSSRKKDWLLYVACFLTLISLIEITLLSRQVKNGHAPAYEEASTTSTLAVNDIIEPLHGRLADGTKTVFDLEGENLLFVYSASCPYCKKNWPNWEALEQHSGKFHVTYIAIDSPEITQAFASAKRLEPRRIVVADQSLRTQLKLFRVPQTIHIHNRRITRINVGVLSKPELDRYVREAQ